MQDIWKVKDPLSLLRLYTLRITLLRPHMEFALDALAEFVSSVERGDFVQCERIYSSLYEHLLTCGSRRVSGSLICDLVFHALLIAPHPFAVMAAGGGSDDAVIAAMKSDLECLQHLSTLDTATLMSSARAKLGEIRAGARHYKDHAAAIASAALSGSPMPHGYSQKEERANARVAARLLEGEWLSFDYGEAALRDDYAADEALSEVYNRLISSDDWSVLTDDLYAFFSQYGCGEFLRCGSMLLSDGGELKPLPPVRKLHEPWSDTDFASALDNAIAFMRGKPCSHMLICGDAGSGKTEFALKLAEELPEMRLVIAKCASLDRAHRLLPPLLDALSAQPLRFMLLLDDCGNGDCAALTPQCIPKNVLLCAASSTLKQSPLFPFGTPMRLLTDREFISAVAERLDELGGVADARTIETACRDVSSNARGRITVSCIDIAAAKVLCSLE
ncbi:MAG: DUF815 domain-containing protein [Clostridia bacterium]|nr:DUF815 domain-containing protein [Clostridia bacterium]